MPFNPNQTLKDRFHVDNETTVPVQMMHQNELLKVYYDIELSSKVLLSRLQRLFLRVSGSTRYSQGR